MSTSKRRADSLKVSVNVAECKICRSEDCTHCNPKNCNCCYENCICEQKCVCHQSVKANDCACVECTCHNVDSNNRTKPLKIGGRPPDTPEFLAHMPEHGLKINEYFKEHKIHEFFHFLMCHLLAKMPDKPIEFLLDLLDRIQNCAVSFDFKPPLLYDEKHIVSIYNAMDPLGFNCINYNQYYNGLITLGVDNFTTTPPLNENKMISKHFFCSHAKQCLILALNDLLTYPNPEDGRSDVTENTNSTVGGTLNSSTLNENENESSQLSKATN